MKKNLFLFIFLGLTLNFAHADSELIKLFSQSFTTHYQKNLCGENIEGFLERAHANGRINLYGSQIIQIKNVGGSMMGLVSAEFVREAGAVDRQFPGPGYRFFVGEKNWYHHVILEKDGLIYDFDFGNTPQVLKVKDYFKKMFLDDRPMDQGGKFYVGKDKLEHYELTVCSGLEFLHSLKTKTRPGPCNKVSLGEYLR